MWKGDREWQVSIVRVSLCILNEPNGRYFKLTTHNAFDTSSNHYMIKMAATSCWCWIFVFPVKQCDGVKIYNNSNLIKLFLIANQTSWQKVFEQFSKYKIRRLLLSTATTTLQQKNKCRWIYTFIHIVAVNNMHTAKIHGLLQ